MRYWIAAILTILFLCAAPLKAERIKDITTIVGERGNQLWGTGLVIGLNGTGDDSQASRQAAASFLRRNGQVVSPDDAASKNIAMVVVTAELPPFQRKGTRIDVTVSALGNASSLQGGTLLMTTLTGADGQVYATVQGSISTGGFAVSGDSASITKNHNTVGRIPAGAIVEKEEIADFVENGHITLQLRNADFTTADRIAKAINTAFKQSAFAMDAGTIRVRIPATLRRSQLAWFIDRLGVLQVEVDFPAVVVINERTGTIVVGQNVGISMVAIAHGNLSIKTQEKTFVSQPGPLARVGNTEKYQESEITAAEEIGDLRVIRRKVSVAELAEVLNAMGLTPRDLVSIFEALRNAGALQAELRIM